MELKLRLSFMQRLLACKLNKSFFIAFAFALTISSNAFGKDPSEIPNFPSVNTPGSDNNNPNAHPPHGASAPFDAGLTLLIAAGIGYGVKRSYNRRNKVTFKEESNEPVY